MEKRINFVLQFLLGISLLWVIQGREGPLLQSYEEEGRLGYNKLFKTIFDTSKYGIYQLDNGLATTPQMGSLFSLSLPY